MPLIAATLRISLDCSVDLATLIVSTGGEGTNARTFALAIVLLRGSSFREGRAGLVQILVVDDNPSVRRYLRAILEQQSAWRVCGEARTGEETFQQVQDSLPDLILLDFQMPDLNGLEIARKIQRSWPKTPILMVTVHMSSQLALAARSAGIRGICAKSDVGSIVEAVQTVLQEKTYFTSLTSVRG